MKTPRFGNVPPILTKGPGASPQCQREAARNFRLIRGHWITNFDQFCGDQIQCNCIYSMFWGIAPYNRALFGLGLFIMIPCQKFPWIWLNRSWSRSTSSQWSFDQSLGCWHLWTSADWWVERSKGSEGDLGSGRVGYSLEQFCNRKNHQNRDMNTWNIEWFMTGSL